MAGTTFIIVAINIAANNKTPVKNLPAEAKFSRNNGNTRR